MSFNILTFEKLSEQLSKYKPGATFPSANHGEQTGTESFSGASPLRLQSVEEQCTWVPLGQVAVCDEFITAP